MALKNELARKQRPIKVMQQKDINPSILEKTFQYYDNQIANLENLIKNCQKQIDEINNQDN